MIKIVSWNINKQPSLWNDVKLLKDNLQADVALLQEAPCPPEGIQIDVCMTSPWRTAGANMKRPWRTVVVSLSEKVHLKAKPLKSIEESSWGEMSVSREGSLAVGEITLQDTGEVLMVASMYSAWEKPDTNPESSWIYADASAHRLISDLSALIGRERGHKIIVAGDLNILYGYGEGGNNYWKKRYETVFSRMEATGLKFVGPQAPDGGVQANPSPAELPASSKNVPTFRPNRNLPESATRQLDFVFASISLQNRIRTRALNTVEEWGNSDHCRVLIELNDPD
jgi:exonuclease III